MSRRLLLPVLLLMGCTASAVDTGDPAAEGSQADGGPPRGSGGSAAASDAGAADKSASAGRSGGADGSLEAGRTAVSQGGGGGASGDGGSDAGTPIGTGKTKSMRLISRGAPAFASSTAYNSAASKANDDDPSAVWTPTRTPAWIAYDLSAVPSDQRQRSLVVWNDVRPGYIYDPPENPFWAVPIDYTIDINEAPGGAPPADGWETVVTVSGNGLATVQHPIELAGRNWVRMNIARSSDPAGGLVLDMNVFSAPEGATDSWLFMGDSITFAAMTYYQSDLPALVEKATAVRHPAIIDGAIAGTSALTAVNVLDDTMKALPGPFVVLAYGTNDLPDEFAGNMETLVEKVIATGRVPVVPHMPWSDQRTDRGPAINASIDALYAKYPSILRGPDLWAFFENRTDLVPPGDLHPNDVGKEELRKQWAAVMAGVP
jgi:hypothetical protein